MGKSDEGHWEQFPQLSLEGHHCQKWNMKLTVCFGDTKVVVPCGSGNLTVRDLTLSGLRRVRHTLPKVCFLVSYMNVLSLQ